MRAFFLDDCIPIISVLSQSAPNPSKGREALHLGGRDELHIRNSPE